MLSLQCIAGIPYGFVSGKSENILPSKLYENGFHGGGKVYEKKKHQDFAEKYGPTVDTQQQTFTTSPFFISDSNEQVTFFSSQKKMVFMINNPSFVFRLALMSCASFVLSWIYAAREL
jgi:hypothetical protein